MNQFATDDILPPPPDAAVLHDREYRVRAYRLGDERLLIQGAIRDQKPPGLYVAEDPDPMTIHHMQVSLEVAYPELEIVDATVHFEVHPNTSCPTITEHYHNVIGLSIARGFTHRIRELFGGPRGCTHTTALLQAMAPVAVQCFWSMRAVATAGASFRGLGDDDGWRRNINSCHVWDADGPHVAAHAAGHGEAPVWLSDRLARFGLTEAEPANDE